MRVSNLWPLCYHRLYYKLTSSLLPALSKFCINFHFLIGALHFFRPVNQRIYQSWFATACVPEDHNNIRKVFGLDVEEGVLHRIPHSPQIQIHLPQLLPRINNQRLLARLHRQLIGRHPLQGRITVQLEVVVHLLRNECLEKLRRLLHAFLCLWMRNLYRILESALLLMYPLARLNHWHLHYLEFRVPQRQDLNFGRSYHGDTTCFWKHHITLLTLNWSLPN